MRGTLCCLPTEGSGHGAAPFHIGLSSGVKLGWYFTVFHSEDGPEYYTGCPLKDQGLREQVLPNGTRRTFSESTDYLDLCDITACAICYHEQFFSLNRIIILLGRLLSRLAPLFQLHCGYPNCWFLCRPKSVLLLIRAVPFFNLPSVWCLLEMWGVTVHIIFVSCPGVMAILVPNNLRASCGWRWSYWTLGV